MSRTWRPSVIVVGSGLAGLSCAERLAVAGLDVTVVSPGRPGRDGATHRVHALAPWILLTAPWSRGDSPDRLATDLRERGEGLERPGLAEVYAESSHQAALELCEILHLEPLDGGRPAVMPGEVYPRSVRCLPMRGSVVLEPLVERCVSSGVRFRERCVAAAVGRAGGRASSVSVYDRFSETIETLRADAVVLACGGSGAVFPRSTSPRWCRGSGIALADRSGVLLHRPGLTQAIPVTATPPLYFPTTSVILRGDILVGGRRLEVPGSLTEATREIAGWLRSGAQVTLTVSEDARTILPAEVRESAGFRERRAVALTVALHHSVGGVAIDTFGRTSMPGLYACGEAAGGVQGARRTMGTGLLEARIFALRAADALARDVVKLGAAGLTDQEEPAIEAVCEPEHCERRIDALMGPLVTIRPADEATSAIAELGAWPRALAEAGGLRGVMAELRRRAAVGILADRSAFRAERVGDGEGEREAV